MWVKDSIKAFEYRGVATMSTRELLISEIEEVPEPLLSEVLDFVHFLKAKVVREKLDIAIMSEFSLSRDWLKPEEDEAWQNL
jgi:hypothetical protein